MNKSKLIVKPVPQRQQKQQSQANKSKPNMFALDEIPRYSHSLETIAQLVFPQTSKVRKIGKFAFSGCFMLSSVTINGTVEEICERCFINCYKLKKFIIKGESHLSTIGERAFKYASLRNFCYPHSLKVIGDKAFYISDFQNFDLSNTQLEVIEDQTFFNSTKKIILPNTIKRIVDRRPIKEVKGGGRFIASEGSLIYSIPGKQIVGREIENLSHLIIRRGIERIGNLVFNRLNIRRVSIPASVKEIGDEAFCCCSKLRIIVFSKPSSLKSIGQKAFEFTKIAKITFPQSLIKIGDHAFEYCTRLKKVAIPSSVLEIGSWAFNYCENLYDVLIPSDSDLQIIGHDCFGRTRMTKFTITRKVREMKGNIFGLTNITDVKIDSPLFHIVSDLIIDKCNEVVAVLSKESKVLIPEGVKSIHDDAFSDNNNIQEVYLPSTMEKFNSLRNFSGNLIFTENSIIKEIPENLCAHNLALYLPQSVEKIPFNTFAHCSLNLLVINNSFFSTYEDGTVYDHVNKGIVFSPELNMKIMCFSEVAVIYGGAYSNSFIDSLSFDKTLKFVGENAFAAQASIEFDPDSHIEKICIKAFSNIRVNQQNFKKAIIKLPKAVDEIESFAFRCKELVLPKEFEFKKLGGLINSGLMIKVPKSLVPKVKYCCHKNIKIVNG